MLMEIILLKVIWLIFESKTHGCNLQGFESLKHVTDRILSHYCSHVLVNIMDKFCAADLVLANKKI